MKKANKVKSVIIRAAAMLDIAALIVVLAVSVRPEADSSTSGFEMDYDLTVWYYDDTLTPYLNSCTDGFFRRSGLRPDFQLISSLEFIDNINKSNVENGEGPDLYIIDSTKLESAYLSSLAKPNDDADFNDTYFLKKALNDASYKGKLAGYPLAYTTSFLAYNTDLIKDKPESLEEISGQAFEFDVNNLLYSFCFVGEYIDLGGEYGDDINSFDFSSDKYTAALGFMHEFSKNVNIDANLIDYNTIEKNFTDNITSMGIFSPVSLLKFNSKEVSYSICQVPDMNNELKSRVLSQSEIICVNPESKDVRGAEELAKYLAFENAENIFLETGLMPARKSNSDDEVVNAIEQIYEGSKSLPKLIETESLWEDLSTMLTSVWSGTEIDKAQNKLNVSVYIALSTRTEQEDK